MNLLSKYSDLTIDANAKYTIIFILLLWNRGLILALPTKAPLLTETTIVETANKSKVIAKISVDKAPGNAFGNDYDTGARLSETYATAGKALGKFLKK